MNDFLRWGGVVREVIDSDETDDESSDSSFSAVRLYLLGWTPEEGGMTTLVLACSEEVGKWLPATEGV